MTAALSGTVVRVTRRCHRFRTNVLARTAGRDRRSIRAYDRGRVNQSTRRGGSTSSADLYPLVFSSIAEKLGDIRPDFLLHGRTWVNLQSEHPFRFVYLDQRGMIIRIPFDPASLETATIVCHIKVPDIPDNENGAHARNAPPPDIVGGCRYALRGGELLSFSAMNARFALFASGPSFSSMTVRGDGAPRAIDLVRWPGARVAVSAELCGAGPGP